MSVIQDLGNKLVVWDLSTGTGSSRNYVPGQHGPNNAVTLSKVVCNWLKNKFHLRCEWLIP